MTNEFNTSYQYDRCTSRGICSINPATSALLEVILLYLKHTAYYGLKLEKYGKKNKIIRNLVLNTISVLSSNYEISENNFRMINSAFKTELPKILKDFNDTCIGEESLDTNSILSIGDTISDYIRYGEKEFNKRVQNMPNEERNLYRILYILIKSLCINILTYESYGEKLEDEIILVFKVLNLLNTPQRKKQELIKFIQNISQKDCKLLEKIRIVQQKVYGEQSEQDVSFSTRKGKAILVVGSNLKELEQILDEFKDKEVDIYTHDNMILAHTFPYFREYKNLRGQFGQGMENCLLDFSTFPGPIILTRNSLFNVESLYRGRLFTTDFAYSKGVIPIKNGDFSEVLKSIENSRGFKNGKNCEKEKIGFIYNEKINDIKKQLSENKYKHAVVIGLSGYTNEEKEYFNIFYKHLPKDILVIDLTCCISDDNKICVNAVADDYAMLKLSEEIIKLSNTNVSIFFPFANRHALSLIINLSLYENCSIFVGRWNQTVVDSNILDGIKNDFGVLDITTPKKDLERAINIK